MAGGGGGAMWKWETFGADGDITFKVQLRQTFKNYIIVMKLGQSSVYIITLQMYLYEASFSI